MSKNFEFVLYKESLKKPILILNNEAWSEYLFSNQLPQRGASFVGPFGHLKKFENKIAYWLQTFYFAIQMTNLCFWIIFFIIKFFVFIGEHYSNLNEIKKKDYFKSTNKNKKKKDLKEKFSYFKISDKVE